MATNDFSDTRSCATTVATRGGINFDQFCRGDEVYYVCDRECLVHITHEDTLQTAEDKLVKKIEDIFSDLGIQKDAVVKKFYIGKMFVQSTRRSRGKINPLNPTTWRKQGISSRWGDHRKEDYGKDGMIVIAVITRDQVPQRETDEQRKIEPVVNQELYTLALEQRLMQYYKITKGDRRLANETFTSGGADKKGSAGYALYVALSLEKCEMEEGNNLASDCSNELPHDLQQVEQDNLQHQIPILALQSQLSKTDEEDSMELETDKMANADHATLEESNELSSREEQNVPLMLHAPTDSSEQQTKRRKSDDDTIKLQEGSHRSKNIHVEDSITFTNQRQQKSPNVLSESPRKRLSLKLNKSKAKTRCTKSKLSENISIPPSSISIRLSGEDQLQLSTARKRKRKREDYGMVKSSKSGDGLEKVVEKMWRRRRKKNETNE